MDREVIRGRVPLLLAAIALGLAACAGPVRSPGDVVASAAPKVDKAAARFEEARTFVDLVLLPLVSPERAAMIRELEDRIERLLWAAKTATTIVAQVRAVDQANAAIDELDGT